MILFHILIYTGYCTIVGIDFGSDTVKVAVGSRYKPVHLVRNLYSNEATPNVFAYRDKNNWAFGEGALDICHLHPELCIQKVPLDKNFYFSGNSLKGYQIMALALSQIIQNVKEIERIEDDIKVVIAIPPSMTNREKSYLYCAITIAGINCVQFVTSTYAPIELYVNERKYESNFYNNAVFIDIGHSGVRVSGFEFNNSEIVQIFGEYNDNLGGKTIDDNLMKLIISKYKFYLSSQKQALLLTEIRKAREQLTVNSKVSFDFHNTKITLTRNDIDDCCYEVKEALKSMIISLKKNHPNLLLSRSVQLIGGCSRIPCLQDYIRQLLPNSRLLRSMDTLSAVCMGACYLITGEIPSQIQVHNSLVTIESILKSSGNVYKIFSYKNTENFNPVVRFNNVEPNQLFKIIDNDQEFTTFSIIIPENQYHYNIYSNTIDVGFTLNYYLMPVPDHPIMIQNHNQQIQLTIDYKKVGWEVDSDELDRSKALVDSMLRGINQRLNIERPSDPIEDYKYYIQQKLKKYGFFNWRKLVFAGICRYIDYKHKSYSEQNDPEKINSLLQDFKSLVKSILDIDDSNYNDDTGSRNKTEKLKAVQELNNLIEACRILHTKYNDVEQWIRDRIRAASLEDIREQIRILQERANRAQEL